MARPAKPTRSAIKAAIAMYAPLDRPTAMPATMTTNKNTTEAEPELDFEPNKKA